MTKGLKIEFAQDVQKTTKKGENVSFRTILTKEVKNSKDLRESVDALVGTSLNELFNLVSVQKAVGVKYFDLSAPISFRIQHLDTDLKGANLDTQFQQVLKLNDSAKSKRKFALRLRVAVEQLTRVAKVVNASAILTELENQIQSEKIEKVLK